MPCFTPRPAWASILLNPKSGKRYISFRPVEHKGGTEQIKVQCSKCDGCRIERSRQWAVRCWHEASLHQNNIFITLTFAPEHLDPQGSLRKPDFQKFMKRLRKRFSYLQSASCWKDENTGRYKMQKKYYSPQILYFHCGEYGEKFGRPHHHACLFNFTFDDLELLRKTPTGFPVYTSKTLSELWEFGIHEIGSVTFQSAAYVARYIIKKVSGLDAYHHYLGKEPEYVTMSRNPAIAKNWFKQFQSDVYPGDFVAMEGGFKCLPPKYYDKQYEIDNPEKYAILKQTRIDRARSDPNNTPERLAVRHELLKRKLKLLKRSYENDN